MYEEQTPQMELQSAVVVNHVVAADRLKELLNTTREVHLLSPRSAKQGHGRPRGAQGRADLTREKVRSLTYFTPSRPPYPAGPWCPYPYTQVVDECFHAHSKKLTWSQARHVCQGMGGDLAEPKHLYALQTYLAQTYGPGYFWVGGTDQDTEGRWHWVSGRPLDPVDWLFSRPDNLGGDEHCLEIVMSDYPKLFNDETCSIAQRFICQYRG
ncbi:C-type lectin 4 [Penaeus vannamei]|uniref:C-type lectin 4 n=1 Tax=Penaeus vannamei TaxID=6689 RepID=A0A423SV28_PENVA|nr:C-type lectin 4 [Penaeus vannamei]